MITTPKDDREMGMTHGGETRAFRPHPSRAVNQSILPSGNVLEDRPLIRQNFGQSPLRVLRLNKEHLLDNCFRRMTFAVIEGITRVLPAIWMYGATIGLVICIVFHYRWGVLFALTVFSSWSALSLLIMSVNGIRAMFQLWANDNANWQQMWRNEQKSMMKVKSGNDLYELSAQTNKMVKTNSSGEIHGDIQRDRGSFSSVDTSSLDVDSIQWNDVFHVVMIASYCTPEDALANTLEVLARYSDAKTNMGIVLGLEQREKNVQEKAANMISQFGEMFRFITATYHPPNLPNHIKGKASNMCWAFQELTDNILHEQGFGDADLYRIVVTNMDDDSEFHDNYFDALTYHFLKLEVKDRYLTLWQPPVAHFKNIATIPAFVRVGAVNGSMADLGRHVNSLDCHTLFSSNSTSLVLTLAVGGYDPDWVSDDWHMLAKCAVMTEGRCKCRSIMLPLVNLMPEEETYCGTLKARWTQVKRHALGISEVVFLITSLYLAVLECPSWSRSGRLLWRTAPLVSKFLEVHFMSSLCGTWPLFSMLSNYLNNLWFGDDVAKDQIVFNSNLAHINRYATTLMIVMLFVFVTVSSMYVHLLKHRISNNQTCFIRHPILFWLRSLVDLSFIGAFQQIIFGSLPEWLAAARIIFQLKIDHAVAAMIGRPDMGEGF